MTRKVYKTARGKEVDLGALLLQNENVRAVGNMNVNARGDVLDSSNNVIDQKNRQVQRQYQRQSVNPPTPRVVATGTRQAKQMKQETPLAPPPVVSATIQAPEPVLQEEELDTYDDLPEDNDEVAFEEPPPPPKLEIPAGGLAAAIARAKTVEQKLDKTPRQLRQESKLKKL